MIYMQENIISDPYSIPAFSIRNKLARTLWWFGYIALFRFSPKPMFGWRRLVLRMFGAKLGRGVAVYPRARIWAPWMLQCEDMVAIANDVEIYNPSSVYLGSHAIISQGAYLCGASHDYDNPAFPLISKPIILQPYSWICARAVVQMGVSVGKGAILAVGGVASKNLDPWCIYGGVPAKKIGNRSHKIR